MSSLSKIGTALMVIFILVLLALLVEILYLFLRRREFHRRFTIDIPQSSSPPKEILYFLYTWSTFSKQHIQVEPTVHADDTMSPVFDHDHDQTPETIGNDQLFEEDRLEEGGISATLEVCLNSTTTSPMEEEFLNEKTWGYNKHQSPIGPATHTSDHDPTSITTSQDQLYEEDRSDMGETRVTLEVGLNSTTFGSIEEEFSDEATPFSTPCPSPPRFFTPPDSPTRIPAI